MRRIAFTLYELYICIIIIAVLILMISTGKGCSAGNGYVDGRITSSGYIGLYWKTKECVIVTGNAGYHSMGLTVYDDVVFESLSKFNSNEMLRFYYKDHPFVWPWNGATRMELYKVEKIKGQ